MIDRRIVKLRQLVEADEIRSPTRLASRLCLSESRLRHLFHDETGNQLSRYLQGRRMREAARLLVGSELAIKEIADRVGYLHSASFIRAFKSHFQETPGQYRERQFRILHPDPEFLEIGGPQEHK